MLCEVDCLEIVEVLRDDVFHFHALASDFLEINQLLQRQWSVQLQHVSRSANEVADCLAGLGLSQQCDFLRLEDPPPQLDPILARDLLAV